MAITYVGWNSAAATTVTSYTIDLTALTGGSDTAVRSGDFVIVVSGWVSTTDGTPGVNTTGYTEAAELYSSDTRDTNLSVSYKYMSGVPDTSVNIIAQNSAANGSAAVAYVLRGVDPVTPMDNTRTTASANNQSSALANAPAIVPATIGAWVVACMGNTADATPVAFTGPSNMSNFVQRVSAATTLNFRAMVSSYTATSTASFDPNAITGGETATSNSWAAVTLAVRPAVLGHWGENMIRIK